ncbi:SUMF1/EgtB/PvdO family nonheme iron enzyme [Pseudomonas sp. 9Ag]|uniref:SUMF1/EgtB/PvdO family nonheme iron enzyme n=1 Tax=Pseudomonas sp. 9Ag TaxID=2653167 RepID=UPI0012F133CB|nr:SUMF1/EgtB/PvdO family nonheme iron enzyme [Pseudomonas sp. 9Ag]VXC49175.1 hypothetical protein PSEUDO9AG_40026 [Pseudomonas sp. 9Ag]
MADNAHRSHVLRRLNQAHRPIALQKVLYPTDDGSLKPGVNYAKQSGRILPERVDIYPPNPIGLYSMTGIATEVVNDWYSKEQFSCRYGEPQRQEGIASVRHRPLSRLRSKHNEQPGRKAALGEGAEASIDRSTHYAVWEKRRDR